MSADKLTREEILSVSNPVKNGGNCPDHFVYTDGYNYAIVAMKWRKDEDSSYDYCLGIRWFRPLKNGYPYSHGDSKEGRWFVLPDAPDTLNRCILEFVKKEKRRHPNEKSRFPTDEELSEIEQFLFSKNSCKE